jgi:hypothetical protein
MSSEIRSAMPNFPQSDTVAMPGTKNNAIAIPAKISLRYGYTEVVDTIGIHAGWTADSDNCTVYYLKDKRWTQLTRGVGIEGLELTFKAKPRDQYFSVIDLVVVCEDNSYDKSLTISIRNIGGYPPKMGIVDFGTQKAGDTFSLVNKTQESDSWTIETIVNEK